jgi:hypothetical protein
MDDMSDYERIEGHCQVIENELAHASESRVFIHDLNGNCIGRAVHVSQTPTSKYNWLLIDVTCSIPIPLDVEIVVEEWTLDAVVFYEGYGFMTATTHTQPTDIPMRKQLHVTRSQEAAELSNGMCMYRFVTLQERGYQP